MKKLLLSALLMMSTTPLLANRDALIEYDDKWNLFSRFELGYTEIDGNGGMLGGVTVGGLLNDKLAVGVSGRTVLDTIETESPFLEDIENTDFWYAGFYTEYVFNPQDLAYFSIDLTIGGGDLSVNRVAGDEESSTFFVMEPGVNGMVNVTETFMLGLGVRYRLVMNTDSEELDDGDLSGIVGTVFMRFTEF